MLNQFGVTIMLATLVSLPCGGAALATLSVNGESMSEADAGSPVIVSATMVDRAEMAAPEWKLTVADDSGTPVSLAAVLRKVEGPVRVGPFYSCNAVWTISAEAIALLPPGEYKLTVGESKPVRLRVVASGATEDAQKKTAKQLLLSHVAELEGKVDEALSHADAILSFDAESIGARLRKADLLVAKNDPNAALKLLEEAEQISRRRFPGEHPPTLITARQAEILAMAEEQQK